MSLGNGWRRLFRHERPEQDVDDEIAFHLAMREEKLRMLGAPNDSAHADALRRFGDVSRIRDETLNIDRQYAREVRMTEWLASVRSDFGFALRGLRRTPAFTFVAVTTLALGIGATSAMFSLVDGILLRPLGYAEPDRLVRVIQAFPELGLDSWGLSQQNVALYRDRVREFSSFAAYTRAGRTLSGSGAPERLSAVSATGDFFDVLGVKAIIGRTFTSVEDTQQTNNVVVLAYGFWQTRFAGDRGVIGKVIDLDGKPMTVIGVTPPDFAFPRADAQVYVPLGLDPSRQFGFYLTGIGRLAPGATPVQARRASTPVMWEWARGTHGLVAPGVDPKNTHMTTIVTPLREAITRDSKRPLEVLQAAVLLILLIAIANVATLLSSRAAAREREVALRNALGATRRRVVRQLLTESVALAAVGAAAGIALAYALVYVITHSAAVSLPRISEVSVSWRVLAFTLLVALIAGLAFGIAPALSLVRRQLAEHLTGAGKGSARASSRRFNNSLVAAQLALSVVLLVSAGLVLKSFRRLLSTDLGFEPANVTTLAVPLPSEKYNARDRIAVTASQIAERTRSVPGVEDAAIAWYLPFSGNRNTDGFIVEGHAPPSNAGGETQTVQLAVGPGFFRTLRIPLKYGRDFTSADRASTTPVMIVDEALARRYWTGADALGKRIRLTGDTTWCTIVGVVGSVRDQDVAEAPAPHTYFPYLQQPDPRPMLAVRTRDNSAATLTAVRAAIHELEPGIPLDNVRPLDSWISRALDTRRITELLLGGFALLATLLASIGIYGVMSLYVTSRYREFGVRLAIGADPAALVGLVLREGLVVALVGVSIGIVGAFGATRWVRALLYDVNATDPLVFSSLSIALLAVAALACYIPARRAARSDPLVALRAE
jgi:predicted permease